MSLFSNSIILNDINDKVVALARYQTIIEAQDNGELDYDSVEPNATKPTKAAIRVNDILETITGTLFIFTIE